MHPDLQAIKDRWDAKTAAKHVAFEAMGEAKLAEKEGRSADAKVGWDVMAAKGLSGEEGQLAREHLELCDAYVEAHPGEFDNLRNLSLEQCVEALSVFRVAGFEDETQRVEVWLRHHFEPQNIGGQVETRLRIVGLGG